MKMYKKIHSAIRENAESQKCSQLLKLIDIAEGLKLCFLYAYNKQTKDGLISCIEVFDEYTYNKFNIKLIIVRNKDKMVINNERVVLNGVTQAQQTYSLVELGKLSKRIENLYRFAQEVEKFNMLKLPVMY